ncbi:DUF4231 domain-containing protein [Streptomyces bugieae]|uniref:DUF4231 domain-containing protein n=1 Tax=Streptomyces bugieae TaxID=3098223 RepID=A0ABU7NZ08_9ACTN|nr:DUF4231 domain-containing protein [Streptomyces sp. DSM 41528]
MAGFGGTGGRDDLSVVALVWRAQSVWSQAANTLKASVERWRTTGLLCGLATAGLGVTSSQTLGPVPALGKAVALLASLTAAGAAFALKRASARHLSEWVRARSVAEVLKSESYLYLAGLGPYRSRAGAAAAEELTRRTQRVLDAASDLSRHTRDIEAAVRDLPPVTGGESYVSERLARQLTDYYRPKARAMARKVSTTERAEGALALLSVVLGGVAGTFGVDEAAAWIPVVATAAGTVTAHAAAAKYAYQEMEFSRTAAQLDHLIRQWAAGGRTEAETQRLAEQGEHVISIQNEAWMAKWTSESGQDQG